MRSTDILIVDDELGIREVLQETLEDEGYTVALACNAEEARALRNKNRPAMVLLDIWMPDSDGITLLKEWAKNGQLTMPVVMMSGHGSIDTAVEATKIGALDFLEKPIPLQKLLAAVENALKHGEMQVEAALSVESLNNSTGSLKELNKQIEHALLQSCSVLLLGETGSSFEMIAHAFHKENTPWVQPSRAQHIVDIPLELLNKATNGVLYLGDISQYSKNIRQSINFLLSKAGRHHTRIICASSRPMHELLGNADQDANLMPILSSTVINIPPLRHHPEDIPALIERILQELAETKLSTPVKFTNAAITKLRQYDWPGNMEQLRNVVNSLALNAEEFEVNDGDVARLLNQFQQDDLMNDIRGGFNFNLPLRELREELERRYFEFHIRQENHNMSRVAQKVGLERTHLYRKLKQLGIQFSRRPAGDKDSEE
ncbi:sigma-54-dependent transcriptional regulator [Kingella negevensis]|uniref:sigma-54-dependent transcriptional regulator n=1 Tax=Kingella negevensis TaxID=1522312 RepID=UPI00050A0FB2|nr:sigma-54 dependent transcriptional regulator [Kingella negevensis]MDK4680508.1 sigma-54 dependent transcriptional regulator [Kingella negevensis]MDK4681769.1 sigma-54 dependent transcriptional regulator [Kingella negevensis]MDK4684976.1 sigma-54 dependent transcriptional regulator [Kingella negevensis]MDK4689222.1 sigma-54 dependent transcriptional regulator [Kingella negevensis]MDK4689966.1 sigma-54 dependent transcriptional regulator [Kingella negevensis]